MNGFCPTATNPTYTGQNAAFRFLNATQTVIALPNMGKDDWYPTVVGVPDANMIVTNMYVTGSSNCQELWTAT